MCPRRSTIRPIGGPSGSPSMRTEPSFAGSTSGAASLTSSTVTSPSMHVGNSSWAHVRHSLVPSARITSSTYCMFLPTAIFSHGCGVRRHLEEVGEGVVLRVVVDDLDRALLVVVQRSELGDVLWHPTPCAARPTGPPRPVFALRTTVRSEKIMAGGRDDCQGDAAGRSAFATGRPRRGCRVGAARRVRVMGRRLPRRRGQGAGPGCRGHRGARGAHSEDHGSRRGPGGRPGSGTPRGFRTAHPHAGRRSRRTRPPARPARRPRLQSVPTTTGTVRAHGSSTSGKRPHGQDGPRRRLALARPQHLDPHSLGHRRPAGALVRIGRGEHESESDEPARPEVRGLPPFGIHRAR